MNSPTTPKDFFLHLGATIALYAGAVALMNLVFSVINYSLPDALAYGYSAQNLAWPISMVVVLVPLLYLLEWLIAKGIRIMPERRSLWIRRWRIYLTLFLTGATIIGDLIVLLNTYLSGEITGRFIYKILTVFIVTGVIFAYFLLERSNDISNMRSKWPRILTISGIIFALAGIVSGFAIVGSPQNQRLIRFDQQKINDLQNIQWQIVNYWQAKGHLPAAMTDLKDTLSYSKLPLDPESRLPYSYTSTASTTFQLCAKFSRASEDTTSRGNYGMGGGSNGIYDMAVVSPMDLNGDNWAHRAGDICFSRQIDPQRYPVTPLKAI